MVNLLSDRLNTTRNIQLTHYLYLSILCYHGLTSALWLLRYLRNIKVVQGTPEWRHSQVVRQRSAKPPPPVQIRVPPLDKYKHYRVFKPFFIGRSRFYFQSLQQFLENFVGGFLVQHKDFQRFRNISSMVSASIAHLSPNILCIARNLNLQHSRTSIINTSLPRIVLINMLINFLTFLFIQFSRITLG